ncbi:hypothetical protein NM688_g766 [Phlebia brevispora]|uniref:Uncharacterized protein n=1 Tax=Phlebia brevispora TaxID=194682 RepID=A0ACC1TDF4_9APHY|nr:hypothetical protein NM688_g766 [Phlebia brevispora]
MALDADGGLPAPVTASAYRRSVATEEDPHKSWSHRGKAGITAGDEDAEVDEVVVDREWSSDLKSSEHSEHGGSPEKSGVSNPQGGFGGTNTDRDSLAIHADGFWASCTPLVWIRYRIWPVVFSFFSTEFMDEKSEAHYRKENWFMRKSLALWAAAFYIVNWVLAVAFTHHPADLADIIFLYAYTPVFTFPLFFMVVYDWPRDRSYFYQFYLAFSTWSWSCYQIIFMFLCGFYDMNQSRFGCENKDFLLTFYYTSALQTIALFGLGFNRFPALIGAIVFAGLAFGMTVPDKTSFTRNMINFIIFQIFLLYVHYMRENAERRLYTLRDQLKIQFRATQKAQINERKAADSKRRLTSYVFHEVRVPLNTALLAVQNMEASGVVAKTQEIEFKALEGSLTMMSKVLNDVLDFNRMDSGRFESVLKPYALHKVMRSLFVPLRLATDTRGLEFVQELDTNIDNVARRALYEARGETPESITRLMTEESDEDGYVVGDEMRLRQIVTNLASNACKFTPKGGKLLIKTKLIIPARPVGLEQEKEEYASDDEKAEQISHGLSTTLLSQHDGIYSSATPLEWIVVRIEVTDTGCGIHPRDMVQSKLFSAFNQTEMGRQQGGKGTGLGLALVRQIVKRSGGRLGVQSKINEGSTFWVELPLGVGHRVLASLSSPNGAQIMGEASLLSNLRRPRVSVSNSPVVPPSTSPPIRQHESALHSIMEQGGLVEMSTKRGERPGVLTRTIGDPSTGTEPVRNHSSSSSTTTSSSSSSSPERPPISSGEVSDSTMKPPRLQLPKPRDFSMETEEQQPDLESLSSSPITRTAPGSASSSTVLASSTATSPPFETGMRVLVVDDDTLTRMLMSRLLTRLGCKVTTAKNGEIALDLIINNGARPTPSSEDTGSSGLTSDAGSSRIVTEDRLYSIVFLDNQMPIMSGLEVVAKLRQMGRKDFVVGVTGNALLSDQQEYLDAGVDYVLTKPVLEKSLTAMLAIADERRKRGTAFPENTNPT